MASNSFSLGSLFSETLSEFGTKFSLLFRTFLFLYFLPVLVLGVILILAMVVTYPSLSISGNVVGDVAGGVTGFSLLGSDALPAAGSLVFLLILLFGLVAVILMIFLNISYVRIGFIDANKTSFSEVFSFAKENFWKYLGFSVVLVLFLAGLFILLIIPGIIFMVSWLLATYVLLGENKGILVSLKESRRLVKGRWWKTFGYLLVLVLLSVVVSVVGSIIPVLGPFVSTLLVSPFMILFLKNYYLKLKKD